jgi:peptidoglycan/LPS O-acetylase OafA/YrhL
MSGTAKPARSRQIDALRALAIVVVLVHHYRDKHFFLSGFGVILFFVLSSYFATGSLLRLKAGIENGGMSAAGALKNFYLNRWLRLWPLYYLVLVLTLLFHVENARSSFFWNAAFLSNIQVLVTGTWNGRFSPLWSLSVLEQFYLLWALVVIACPRRWLPAVILSLIACGPLYRLGCLWFSAPPIYWCVVPLASFDQLGCGALLALCIHRGISRENVARIEWFAGRIAVPVFLLLVAAKFAGIDPVYSAIYASLAASFTFFKLTALAAKGNAGLPLSILAMPWICHVGRISYSIYLLHDFTELLLPKSGMLDAVLHSNYRVLVLIPLTVLIAHVAWCLVEAPLVSVRKKLLPVPIPGAPVLEGAA